jgi:hypothetical protein
MGTSPRLAPFALLFAGRPLAPIAAAVGQRPAPSPPSAPMNSRSLLVHITAGPNDAVPLVIRM